MMLGLSVLQLRIYRLVLIYRGPYYTIRKVASKACLLTICVKFCLKGTRKNIFFSSKLTPHFEMISFGYSNGLKPIQMLYMSSDSLTIIIVYFAYFKSSL